MSHRNDRLEGLFASVRELPVSDGIPFPLCQWVIEAQRQIRELQRKVERLENDVAQLAAMRDEDEW